MIDRYHYLGYSPIAGGQIRYFVRAGEEILALLGFCAAAWKVAARDIFKGIWHQGFSQGLHGYFPVTEKRATGISPFCLKLLLRKRVLPEPATRPPTGAVSAIPRAGGSGTGIISIINPLKASGSIPYMPGLNRGKEGARESFGKMEGMKKPRPPIITGGREQAGTKTGLEVPWGL